MQVRAAYHPEPAVKRNNFNLITAFCAKWRAAVAIPGPALLTHLPQSGPVRDAGDAVAVRRTVDAYRLGLKLLAAGELGFVNFTNPYVASCM